MAAFYSLLCKAIKKQPAGRSGRLFWRSGRDSNPRAIARKLISVFRGENQLFSPALIELQRLLKSPPSGRASPVSIACAEVILDL